MAAEECSCDFASTWGVFRGSLHDSITFESPDFLIEEDDGARGKDLLVLKPLSANSGPCEITVTLQQRYEVRQVYIISTARTYEIYYSPDKQSGNEYLCTVRCGPAMKEDGMVHLGDMKDPIQQSESPEENDRSDSNNSSNEEDGWVKVKTPDSHPQCDPQNLTFNEVDGSNDQSSLDFYEATAEITDASPCVSLTLRLVSLQNKGIVHIKEIFIYADRSEPIHSSPQLFPSDSSSRSSLLAMLAPCLLQLPKSDIYKRQEEEPPINLDSRRQRSPEVVGGNASFEEKEIIAQSEKISRVTNVQEESVKSPVERAEHVQVAFGQQVLDPLSGIKNNQSVSLEGVLNQLDLRLGRIEAFCSRFEENMLKFLNCTETRFQQLENRLDALARTNPPSLLATGSRIVAPKYSSEDFEANCNTEDKNHDVVDLVKDFSSSTTADGSESVKDLETCTPIDDHWTDGEHLPPSLAVTAPEFSNDDERKGCDESLEGMRQDCPVKKAAISIDEALASALCAFLDSMVVETHQLSPILQIKAPDFVNTDDDDNDESVSLSAYGIDGAENSVATPGITTALADGVARSVSGQALGTFVEDQTDEHSNLGSWIDGNSPSKILSFGNLADKNAAVSPASEEPHVDDTTYRPGSDEPSEKGDEVFCNFANLSLTGSRRYQTEVLSQESGEACEKSDRESHETEDASQSGSTEIEDINLDMVINPTMPVAVVAVESNGDIAETVLDPRSNSNKDSLCFDVEFVADHCTSSMPLERLLSDAIEMETTAPVSGDGITMVEGEQGPVDAFVLGERLLIDVEGLDLDRIPFESNDQGNSAGPPPVSLI